MAIWPEVGWVEVMEGTDHVPRGRAGELVCTGLLNDDMPLIRYRVGDRGALLEDERPCGCGRLLPALAYVEGRMDDVLYASDGRRVGRLDPVFKAGVAVREAQVIQERIGTLRVRYVPAPGFSVRDAASIVEGLRARMGPQEVTLEEVVAIPRTANGKFRAVICEVDPEELRHAVQ